MHKYSSFYLSQVFSGIQKYAYAAQGAVNATADAAEAIAPAVAAYKLIPKGFPAGGVKGLGAGIAATTGLEAITPKFNDDSYLGQVGNELRSFGVSTGGAAAGAAAVSGGAAALPGAIQGAAYDVGNKLWRVGKGLNSLFNPYSEHNKSIAEGKERNDRLDKQYRERMANRKPKPPATTAPVGPQTLPPKPPVGVPATTPATAAPIAQPVASTNSVAPASVPPPAPAIPPVAPAIPPVAPVAVPSPTTPPLPASSPVSAPSPVVPPPNNLTPKQRMDKATVARVKSQRDRALEYAGLDPKAPPQQFSGFAPPTQQPTETNSFLPQSNPQVPQPKPVAQPPTGASNPQKFNVVKTPHGTVVGGNVFDKLRADGKIPQDFQLTKEMRVGQQALPPEIQKAKDEFLRNAKATS